MPIYLRNACVIASVLLISRENISLPAILVNGVSCPNAWAIPVYEIHTLQTLKLKLHNPPN